MLQLLFHIYHQQPGSSSSPQPCLFNQDVTDIYLSEIIEHIRDQKYLFFLQYVVLQTINVIYIKVLPKRLGVPETAIWSFNKFWYICSDLRFIWSPVFCNINYSHLRSDLKCRWKHAFIIFEQTLNGRWKYVIGRSKFTSLLRHLILLREKYIIMLITFRHRLFQML